LFIILYFEGVNNWFPAIDHIGNLNANLAESQRQVDLLRIELEKTRDPHYTHIANPPIVHSQGPTAVPAYASGRPGDVTGGPSNSSPTGLRAGTTHSYTHPSGQP
jgi:hypothetical protein